MKLKDEDIKQVIPQREPFIMLDEIETCDDTHAVTALTVRADNYFMLPDGTISETCLIEHIAQSCSAMMGCQILNQHFDNPPVGLIGEVKRFECQRRPRLDERIETSIEFGFTFGNVTIANGESRIGKEMIAKAQLKIFVQQ
jgi:predicted hotdog family 3-hydroxylacyl-ACP dehydratase